MARHNLLQVVLITAIIGTSVAQDTFSVLFPSHSPVVDLAPPAIRTRNRPRCSQQVTDPSAPCVADGEYNSRVRELVNRFIRNSNSVNEIVSDPMLSIILNDTLTPVSNGMSPTTRFGGPRESPVCDSREELIFPQRAKTPKDDWVFVVNQDNVKQALRVERCIGEGNACGFGVPITRDVRTVCRQKYVYRRMLAIGNNNIQPEEVLMPSCCVCYVERSNFDVSVRIPNAPDDNVTTNADPAASAPAPAAPTGSVGGNVAPSPHNTAISFGEGSAPSNPSFDLRTSSVSRRQMAIPHGNNNQFWHHPPGFNIYRPGGR